MTETEKNEIIEEILNSKEFTESIEESIPPKVKIDTDLRSDMKEISKQFVDLEYKSDPRIQKIVQKKKKDRTDDENEKLNTFRKKCNKKFKSILKLAYPDGGNDPIGSMVEKLIHTAQILKFLGIEDISERFKDSGLVLNIPDLEETNPYYAENGVKEIMSDIFNQANDINTQIKDKLNEIVYHYATLGSNIIYDSEVNPEGVTKSQFMKLVKTKAAAVEKPEKFTEIKEKTIQRDAANLISQEICLEKTKML